MTTQPNANNRNRPRNFPQGVGLVASKAVGGDWQESGFGLPIHPELGKVMFGGQMAQGEIKKPLFVSYPGAVKLVNNGGWLLSDEPRTFYPLSLKSLPSADKSRRHPLAQAWRDATPTPNPSPIAIGEGNTPVNDELVISNYNLQPVLLLTAGEIPLLLTAGESIPVQPTPDMEELEDAMARAQLESSITWVDFTETRVKFVNAGLALPEPTPVLKTQVEVEPFISTDKLEASALEIPPALTEAEHEALAVQVVAAADGLSDGVFIKEFGVVMLASLLNQKLVHTVEGKLYPGASSQPAKPVLPIAQDLDPLAQAVRTKQLKRNTALSFTLARAICNDGNEVTTWLKVNFGITNYSLVNDELIKAVQTAVAAEQLRYAQASTLAELNAYGISIYNSITWTGSASAGASKYSQGRTRFINRLYQEQAELWLAELKKKATPPQLLEAGRRMDTERGKAMRFASSGRAH